MATTQYQTLSRTPVDLVSELSLDAGTYTLVNITYRDPDSPAGAVLHEAVADVADFSDIRGVPVKYADYIEIVVETDTKMYAWAPQSACIVSVTPAE